MEMEAEVEDEIEGEIEIKDNGRGWGRVDSG
jgi:hypothetical protein